MNKIIIIISVLCIQFFNLNSQVKAGYYQSHNLGKTVIVYLDGILCDSTILVELCDEGFVKTRVRKRKNEAYISIITRFSYLVNDTLYNSKDIRKKKLNPSKMIYIKPDDAINLYGDCAKFGVIVLD